MPQASKMGGFLDPFVPEPAWPQDTMFIGSSWPGDPAATYLGVGGAAAPAPDQGAEFHLQNNVSSASTGALFNGIAKEIVSPVEELHEQFLSAHHLPDDVTQHQHQHQQGLSFEVNNGVLVPGTLGSVLSTPCAISLADSAPVVCSSNDSSGSEQSGLPGFLLGEQQPAWFPQISSLVGDETSQSFGFSGAVSSNDLLREASKKYPQLGNVPSAPLRLHDDVEFNTGKLLSFTPGLGQQVNTANFGDMQLGQKEFGGLHRHLNLSSLVSVQQLSSFNATGATHNPEQSSEVSSGKIGLKAPPFMTRPEVANGNGAAGNGAPKPRVRARRGQATDPHSIAERLRREKISDRMKNLQELVPNSNRTDKASMLEEIIEYVKFLQLQVKVLSMSRLGATEAVVPLLTEPQTEVNPHPARLNELRQKYIVRACMPLLPVSDWSCWLATQSSGGLLLSPTSSDTETRDGAAFEQEVAQLMESNMTTAMQYLQSKGLCLMPIALASAISDQKGASSAAVQPENGGAKEMLRAVKPLRSPIQGR